MRARVRRDMPQVELQADINKPLQTLVLKGGPEGRLLMSSMEGKPLDKYSIRWIRPSFACG